VNRNGFRIVVLSALALAVCAVPAAEAKNTSPKSRVLKVANPANQSIPNATAAADGVLASTIEVKGNKASGRKIRDVNVTLQTTGSGANAALDLRALLTAPSGATTWLFSNALIGQNFGPLTFDDETANYIGTGAARDSHQLTAPYVGAISQPNCFFAFGGCTLSAMDDGRVTGTWTLTVSDRGVNSLTSTLNGWSLRIRAEATTSKKRN
jgi:subtilisin-like proprotein convertase family protein